MKLKSKFEDEDIKLGEAFDVKLKIDGGSIAVEIENDNIHQLFYYDSLAELNDDWEDYEEPKNFWEIDSYGRIQELEKPADSIINPFWKKRLEIGNYFETQEEAEKAVEKLKAWKRLKDKGFRFGGWEDCNGKINTIYFCIPENKWGIDTCDDLSICFGDEE